MQPDTLTSRLKEKFGSAIVGEKLDVLDPWIEVAPNAIVSISKYLREDPELEFDTLSDLTVVDYFEPDPKKAAKFPFKPHLEVVYHLFSLVHKHRIVIKVSLPRWKGDKEGEIPEIASVSQIWGIADWHEREAYDLVGVHFNGHPNLRRILCPEDWEGHPLRKDYAFPLEYHGIRGK